MTAGRIESELKYWAADERPLQALATAPRLGPAELGVMRTAHEMDRYLDTSDLRLSAARWACRLRERDGRTIVSLKGPAQHALEDPLHRRAEMEGPAGPELEPQGWPPSPARQRLLEMTGGAALLERFRLEQERTERVASIRGTRMALLSLDRVRVAHRGVDVGRLAVVELELDPAAMAAGLDHRPLAAALAAVPGLVADPTSKFDRALALISVG